MKQFKINIVIKNNQSKMSFKNSYRGEKALPGVAETNRKTLMVGVLKIRTIGKDQTNMLKVREALSQLIPEELISLSKVTRIRMIKYNKNTLNIFIPRFLSSLYTLSITTNRNAHFLS